MFVKKNQQKLYIERTESALNLQKQDSIYLEVNTCVGRGSKNIWSKTPPFLP